jgi:hypothetical protein
MRRLALGLLALPLLVAASSDASPAAVVTAIDMGTATAAAAPLVTQHLAFPARSRSRAEAKPSAVSCAEMAFNVRAPAVDAAARQCRHPQARSPRLAFIDAVRDFSARTFRRRNFAFQRRLRGFLMKRL